MSEFSYILFYFYFFRTWINVKKLPMGTFTPEQRTKLVEYFFLDLIIPSFTFKENTADNLMPENHHWISGYVDSFEFSFGIKLFLNTKKDVEIIIFLNSQVTFWTPCISLPRVYIWETKKRSEEKTQYNLIIVKICLTGTLLPSSV